MGQIMIFHGRETIELFRIIFVYKFFILIRSLFEFLKMIRLANESNTLILNLMFICPVKKIQKLIILCWKKTIELLPTNFCL